MRRRENSFLIRTLENESNAERYFCGDSAAVLEANTGYWLFSIADRGDFTKLYSEIGRDIRHVLRKQLRLYPGDKGYLPGADGARVRAVRA